MQKKPLQNFSLIALAASYGVQIGAGVFALSVIARKVSAAPPRSLAILQGEYGYDSGPFWQTVPPITGALFLLAILANWKTPRRYLLLGAFALYVVSGVATVLYLEPLFAEVIAGGYNDTVDPILQAKAATWYTTDWMLRAVDALSGITLLVALTRSAANRETAVSP